MALQRYHQNDTILFGYTPAHLLCMKEVTQRNMSLIRHFSIINQQSFTMSVRYPDRGNPLLYGYSALHVACQLGQPSEELLQHLLQLDSSQTKKTIDEYSFTPLGYLFTKSPRNDRLITCLINVDSSIEAIASGIGGCLESDDYSRCLERVEMLLKANPEAVKYRNPSGRNLLHFIARNYSEQTPSQLFITVMNRVPAIRKEAMSEVASRGWLPVHFTSRYASVEVMEFLLGLYPESSSIVCSNGIFSWIIICESCSCVIAGFSK